MSQINVNNLTFYYEGSYDNIFENVSFQLNTDWKLGFIGRNGKGKTTFLNLLMGKYEYKGKISASVMFDYFDCFVYFLRLLCSAQIQNYKAVVIIQLLRTLKLIYVSYLPPFILPKY